MLELLEKLSKAEFETLTDDIKSSLAEHRKWMRVVNIAIVTKEPVTDKAFIAEDSFLHCNFGRWMTHILTDDLFRKGPFLKIDQLHRQFHVLAKDLLLDVLKDNEIESEKYTEFLDTQYEFFELVLSIFEFSVVNKHQFDKTTKLMNRRTVDTILAHEHHRMKRLEEADCCIVMADIDNFKRFNDNYGHDVGDIALEHCANIFNSAVRRYDTVARYGGEEFLFILPDMNITEATRVIERVRQNLQSSIINQGELSLNITSSFGITQLCRNCDIEESIKRADIALYYAKKNQKNKVVSVDVSNVGQDLVKSFAEMNIQKYTLLIERHCQIAEICDL